MESEGYSDIRIKGGGRILRDDASKKVHIFGYSYGFGRADHEMAKEVVEKSINYSGYTVTWYVALSPFLSDCNPLSILIGSFDVLFVYRSNDGY